ncbi:ParA family protein [Vibrio sp.]|nr:ParA family protein [Vibrio sp.]
MKIWSVANQKGGVGKTTTAVTLAGILSQRGSRVLLVDTDPHASMTTYLGYNPDELKNSLFDVFQLDLINHYNVSQVILQSKMENIDILPAHMSLATLDRVLGTKQGMGLTLKKALWSVKDDYDYVLIDCPPILGVMMVNALAASDRILIPVQTEFLAVKGLERMLKTLYIMQNSRKKSFDITIIPTMYDKRTKASLQTLLQLKNDYPDEIWPSAVPVDTKFRDASLKRLPVSHFAPGSRGVFAYKQLLIYLSRIEDNG